MDAAAFDVAGVALSAPQARFAWQAVGCGGTMEGTISFPVWYILLHIALACLSGTYCMPLDFVWYLFDEVL